MSALNWKPFVYGGLASITAECGTFPIDLTKTRLQIQGQKNDANFKEIRYRGMLHALVRIGREEGLKALYSGIAPAMLRQASYGTIKIGTYQSLKRLFVERPEDETLLINVVCGILSGVISSSIANPTDVLKIRMQAQSSTLQGGMIGNFINIYQQEGTRGLWKGVSLTAQRAAIVVGVELPVYDLTKKHLILSGLMGDTVYTHFLSSFTCGLAGALASNPVDVVRTRMMNQRVLRDGKCPGYRGTLDCLVQTWKNEGFFALYKGFWPNWLRLGPWNIIADLGKAPGELFGVVEDGALVFHHAPSTWSAQTCLLGGRFLTAAPSGKPCESNSKYVLTGAPGQSPLRVMQLLKLLTEEELEGLGDLVPLSLGL